jgi:hypothetical protein
MLQFLRRLRRSGLHQGQLRRVVPAFRPHLERLEERELLTAPLPPTGVVATGISSSAITVNWNASTDPSVTGYDVYAKIWVVSGGGKGSHSGHWSYVQVGSNLTNPTETITGLAAGSTHTYVVTDVNSSGKSLYSYTATAETWSAPGLPYGASTVLLSSGASWSSPVSATAKLTTQFSLLASGNPLTYSVVSGPSNVKINPQTGVVTFLPTNSQVGTINVTFEASNALGSVTQTIQINVAPYPSLPTPTLKLSALSAPYNGQYQQVSATAVGTDGVTPVAGTFSYAYNGGPDLPVNAGTYLVLVTFTSGDSHYGNATRLASFTIGKATPTFSNLTSPTIAQGDTTTTLSGSIAAGAAVPAGDYVIVTLNGVSEAAMVGTNGTFAVSFDTSTLPMGTYTVAYKYAGDANFSAANTASSTLKVIPTAPPAITQNPSDAIVSAGDGVSFTAAATGSPTPTVQWQVSTDGGVTWTNVTSNASAQTTTLTLLSTSTGMNGYKYRAVFTNRVGTATTTAATLTVESDN